MNEQEKIALRLEAIKRATTLKDTNTANVVDVARRIEEYVHGTTSNDKNSIYETCLLLLFVSLLNTWNSPFGFGANTLSNIYENIKQTQEKANAEKEDKGNKEKGNK